MLEFKHVDGNQPVDIKLFTLSTCGWCKKTKTLFKELGVGYDYVDVDLIEQDRQQEAREEMKKFNADCSFPTIIVNGNDCIIGFKEDEIRKMVSK
ncbi:MAG: glutaredoxin family protein [Armatimonadota bacterium]